MNVCNYFGLHQDRKMMCVKFEERYRYRCLGTVHFNKIRPNILHDTFCATIYVKEIEFPKSLLRSFFHAGFAHVIHPGHTVTYAAALHVTMIWSVALPG